MFLMDYHHHTNHSFDSTASMVEVCKKAVENEIQEICFTEHFSVNPLAPTYGHMVFEKYLNEIWFCQEQFKGQLTLKAGIELCEPHLLKDQYDEILQPLDLDFILGSVHNLNNQKLRLALKEDHPTAYERYFNELYHMISTADIDILAHFDLMKRYAYKEHSLYDFHEYQEIIEQILKKAIDRNIGIEINTSGLRTGLKQTLPSVEIIQLYKQLGGEIVTIGSDSHTAESVGANLTDALSLAKDCGFNYICKFEKRKPIPVKI
ncbi:histidinol-phosphatase HisJ family protein [Bacillus sp. ISL-40]|uniref:histidinol-phosphatase HisJ family protein n=1 Tax=unclassified Bacillus (in: firmicutes) TaxID=185979 RepID=UPI001BEC7E3A|nr:MULTISPECIES: histidinol-phosphatase HisJ family protein [unclassified Bacillus (in: firmicutes)]MBT2697579.1 histidinol-phosphatase HisJ family protein [Bacillus sp. ISL-40]MBT2720870.1 histidinol-phosphatase HisJ family protein [Bacillus sp. ISL-46]MBT2742284.1 histidinol-phosphatase HisJ family protein [Bacillus sp. ISL-77]